jgi:hypothetical protein
MVFLPVILMCPESHELTGQLLHAIGTGHDQRLVVLIRSVRNQ